MIRGRPQPIYVYVLFRPWNGEPCYVGKGCNERAHVHNKKGADHPNAHLAAIYRRSVGPLPVVVLRSGLSESEAFSTEVALIAAIGRAPRGPLTNLTDGGEGPCGAVQSQACCEKKGAALRG